MKPAQHNFLSSFFSFLHSVRLSVNLAWMYKHHTADVSDSFMNNNESLDSLSFLPPSSAFLLGQETGKLTWYQSHGSLISLIRFISQIRFNQILSSYLIICVVS